jgi:LmbE family N-acetylglucosaminyl deacetylase
MLNKKDSVLVFCAHPDDNIFGAGGTLVKYSKEGKSIITVIFSYGESSHPWLKEKVTAEMRIKEHKEAEKIIGGKKTVYFGLKENNFLKDIEERNIKEQINKLIKRYKPMKIFTHSIDDPHPDHKAVYSTLIEIADKIRYKGGIYSFDVWNPINIRKRNNPKLVVDISNTFKYKLKAIKCHKSQKLAIFFLILNIYVKAFFNGIKNGVRFAEVFYKIR